MNSPGKIRKKRLLVGLLLAGITLLGFQVRQTLTRLAALQTVGGEGQTPLEAKLETLEGLDEARVAAVVAALEAGRGVPAGREVSWVPFEQLDINRAVPTDMRRGVNEAGAAGVWVTLQDESRQAARFFLPEQDLTADELRALRTYELIEATPMLHALRPLLFEALMRATHR